MSISHMTSMVSFSSTQASDNHGNSSKTQQSHLRKSSPNYPPQNFKSSYDEAHSSKFSPSSNAQYCTLESSSTTSLSSASESQGSDNTPESPVEVSCVTEDMSELKDMLKELESIMLGPEPDEVDSFDTFDLLMEIPKGDVKHVLIACAKAIAEDKLAVAEWLITELRHMVSVSGEPIQRVGAYLLEGLIARIFSSGSAIYKALKCKEVAASSDLMSYMHVLSEVCPFFKFGYVSANGAIVEAVKNDCRVHIIDFQIMQGVQWFTLIQALATRPGGPPHLRITGIDDSFSAHARGGGLHAVEQTLTQFAESCNVPFEFHPSYMTGCEAELKPGILHVRPGDALVVNFAFQLHHMPDESVSTANHRDRLLRFVKSLGPKIVTLIEQESNSNTAAFFPRFLETLDYYNAVFESIDVTLPRENKERIKVEQHCLAREIVNIVACEGAERVERHEVHGKWKSRLRMAGFTPCPMSVLINAAIKSLLESYCEKFKLEERDGALYLGWMNRALVVASAWQ